MEAVGPLQIRVLHHLWSHGPGTVGDVHSVLNAESERTGGRQLAYTTVLTVMRNLVRRSILDQAPVGRAHRFTPLITKTEYQQAMMRQACIDLFGGDPRELVRSLTDDEQLAVDLRERLLTALA